MRCGRIPREWRKRVPIAGILLSDPSRRYRWVREDRAARSERVCAGCKSICTNDREGGGVCQRELLTGAGAGEHRLVLEKNFGKIKIYPGWKICGLPQLRAYG